MNVYIVSYKKLDIKNGFLVSTHKGFLNKKQALSFKSKVRRGLIDKTFKGLTYERLIKKKISTTSEGILDALNFNTF
jgi:hypothetical protein